MEPSDLPPLKKKKKKKEEEEEEAEKYILRLSISVIVIRSENYEECCNGCRVLNQHPIKPHCIGPIIRL